MKTVSFQAKDKKLGAGGKGLPIPKNANQIAMAAGPDATERANETLAETRLRDPSAVDEQFPTAAHIESDPRDPMLALKAELVEDNLKAQKEEGSDKPLPGVTPFGVLQAKDSDFQRLIEIRERELEKQFEQWFATNFDRMDPTHKAMARQLFGKFYNDRLSNLDTNLETTKRIARLKITGPQTKEDLYLMYAMEAGLIDTDYLDNILHPEKVERNQQEEARQKNYRRGMFNPKRFVRGDWGLKDRLVNAKNITGRNTEAQFGNTFRFGTEGKPFTVQGNVSATEEKQTNFRKTLSMLENDDTVEL
jgi:hypothetical protein